MSRDGGHRPFDVRRRERSIVEPLDLQLVRIGAAEGEPQATGEVQQPFHVVFGHAVPDRRRRQRSIHQAGVHVGKVHDPREAASQRGLAAARGPVDRDDPGGRHPGTSIAAPIERSVSTKPGKLTAAASMPSTSEGRSAASEPTVNAMASR